MVCPDFQGLLLPHQQPDTLSLFVFQQFDLASAPFFPFPRFIVKSVQLAFPRGKQQTIRHAPMTQGELTASRKRIC